MSKDGKARKIGRPKQKTCLRGHSLTDPANLYIGSDGCPRCRTCKNMLHRGYYIERKRLRQEADRVS